MAKLLIVDDDQELRGMLAGFLQSLGYEVEQAASVNDALARLQQSPPDLVMLDMGLPDSEGSEGLQKIRSAFPSTKVVMVTGNADGVLEKETRALGALDYITKPFDLEQIAQKLERMLS